MKIVTDLKKKRPELSQSIDEVVASEERSRLSYCQLIGALEDGADRWRAMWTFECEVKESERLNKTLINYK